MKNGIFLLIIICLLIVACGKRPIEVTQNNISSINCQLSEILSDPPFRIVGEDESIPPMLVNEGVTVYHSIRMVKRFEENVGITCSLWVFENEDSAQARWAILCSNNRDEPGATIAGDASCSIEHEVVRQIAFVRGTVVFLAVGTEGDHLLVDELVGLVDGRLTGEIAVSPTN